jgi:hypothetical protein
MRIAREFDTEIFLESMGNLPFAKAKAKKP